MMLSMIPAIINKMMIIPEIFSIAFFIHFPPFFVMLWLYGMPLGRFSIVSAEML